MKPFVHLLLNGIASVYFLACLILNANDYSIFDRQGACMNYVVLLIFNLFYAIFKVKPRLHYTVTMYRAGLYVWSVQMVIWMFVSLRKYTQLSRYAKNDSIDPHDSTAPGREDDIYNFAGYVIGLAWYCWLLLNIPTFEPEHIRSRVKLSKSKFLIHRIASTLSLLWFAMLAFVSSNNNNVDRTLVISVNSSMMLFLSILALFSRPQRNNVKSNIKHGYTRIYMAISYHFWIVFLAYSIIFVERWATLEQSNGESVCSEDCEYFLNYFISLLPLGYFSIFGFKWFSPRDILDAHPRDLIACKMNCLDSEEVHSMVPEDEKMSFVV
eukprot:NODE_521_length_7287_cov_0.275042.p3 type:complete len:325 gc:universal NODE_521_length_7287_cov_0.275042:2842-3816(+)